jgi:glycosyltransferase involved in cell wall biosynthesis
LNLNLTAGFNSTGYGQVATNLLAALSAGGHAVSAWPLGQSEVEPRHAKVLQEAIERSKYYDNRAPSLRIYHQWHLAQHVGRTCHAAYPFFELDTLTDVERHQLNAQDIVFVASDWARRVLRENDVNTTIEVIHPGVDSSVFTPAPILAGSTTFLHVGKMEVRKGFPEVLEAFGKAFTAKDDVRLILHCYNPFMNPERVPSYNADWQRKVSLHPLVDKIHVTPGRFGTQAEVASLMAQADCGVFPSRAEGWNLELAEMLAMGRHVIATDYSAHTEFAHSACCRLIGVDRTETAYDGVYFVGQGNWAYLGPKQLDHLIEHMRAIHRWKQAGELQQNQVGIETMSRFTWAHAAYNVVRYLGV